MYFKLCLTSLFTAALFLPAGEGCAESISFIGDRYLNSKTGYIVLSWENTAKTVELQQDMQPTFDHATTIYQGKNRAIMLSGLLDGTYYYRIRAHHPSTDNWSETLTLQVSHHSWIKAWFLLISGAFIFLCIVRVIIRGASDES